MNWMKVTFSLGEDNEKANRLTSIFKTIFMANADENIVLVQIDNGLNFDCILSPECEYILNHFSEFRFEKCEKPIGNVSLLCGSQISFDKYFKNQSIRER